MPSLVPCLTPNTALSCVCEATLSTVSSTSGSFTGEMERGPVVEGEWEEVWVGKAGRAFGRVFAESLFQGLEEAVVVVGVIRASGTVWVGLP